MLFTTLGFLVFFVAVYLAHWSLRGRVRTTMLLLASIAFYAVWSVVFAIHFLAAVGLTYLLIRRMQNQPAGSRARSAALATAIILLLANLFLFKYFYLFLSTLHLLSGVEMFSADGFNRWLETKTGYDEIVLPLAISFYTFQLIAFAIDVQRDRVSEQVTSLKFFTFIMFFPQLVAGPILRYQDFYPHIDSPQASPDNTRRGIYLILQGLIKKVVVADNMIGPVQTVFASPEQYDALSCLIAAAGFSVRVFCDFSGYTDMARGLGLLLGYNFPENFHAPFLRTSLRELWQGWHMTLTMWMRDYIYISLGGNRRGPIREHFNLILTFTLVGAWHGANYTYILWGFMHGICLSIERILGGLLSRREGQGDMLQAGPEQSGGAALRWLGAGGAVLRGAFVFIIFVFGAIYFNSATVELAHRYMWQMVSLGAGKSMAGGDAILGLSVIGFGFNALQLFRQPPRWRPALQYALLLLLGLLTVILLGRFAPGSQDYIYFQF